MRRIAAGTGVLREAGRAAMSGPLFIGGSLALGARLARKISRPVCLALAAELVQIFPGVQPAVVPVVKHQFDGVLSHRFDRHDADVLLAEHQHLLARTVALDLGGGRMHAQILEGQLEAAAVGEAYLQHTRGAAQADLGGDGLGHKPSIGTPTDWTGGLLQRTIWHCGISRSCAGPRPITMTFPRAPLYS